MTRQIVAINWLNGDGAMEIITHGEYYEGDAVAVLTVDGLEINQVLIEGCGA